VSGIIGSFEKKEFADCPITVRKIFRKISVLSE